MDGGAGRHGRSQPRLTVVPTGVVTQVKELRRDPLLPGGPDTGSLDPCHGQVVAIGVERTSSHSLREAECAQIENFVLGPGEEFLTSRPAPFEGTMENPGTRAVALDGLRVDLDLCLKLVQPHPTDVVATRLGVGPVKQCVHPREFPTVHPHAGAERGVQRVADGSHQPA